MATLSAHRGLWTASAPASGLQVIDRLIRASPCLWACVIRANHAVDASDGVDAVDAFDAVNEIPEVDAGRLQACGELASVASCVMASPCSVQLIEDRISLMRKWRCQLGKLLLAPGIEQRTDAWYKARTELTTASDVASAIGGRNGSSKEFLVKKAGAPEEQKAFSGSAPPLKWGIMFEPVANAIYSRRMGVSIHEFGLLRHPDISHIGASPDGISESGVMIEIKCPFSRIIDGTVPSAYVAQIQCQLDVCGLDECDFFECQFDETGASGAVSDLPDEPWDGCERGILVEYWDETSKTHVYHYCPDMGSDSEQEIATRESWAALTIKGLEAVHPCVAFTIRRWKLRSLDIVRVHRDSAYIESMNASLAVVWNRVLRYRGDREAYKLEVLGVGAGARRTAAASLASSSTATATAAAARRTFVAVDAPLQGYAFMEED